ncbi:MAG: hypothetical protein A2912_03900 [Candidatus Buchananbacteria bacterium RIFCSPLOWO2_01_FULL_40_23b]|uniref:Uncharacterized protein n=1 Tax=Candidatus Buchananbacteria bacterium RIFCSPLOWO2_01_FULL_40_23b TaxID=1797544 RepID=A0A1G1YN44_9BACT|nr:MAG: hypothetical protein A2912_03900 [Candidatus Buchananbacteria bacterium RIFCSPLOWO2_01_FULL_40_23b]
MTTPNSTNQTREGRSNVIQFPIRKQVPEIDYEQATVITGLEAKISEELNVGRSYQVMRGAMLTAVGSGLLVATLGALSAGVYEGCTGQEIFDSTRYIGSPELLRIGYNGPTVLPFVGIGYVAQVARKCIPNKEDKKFEDLTDREISEKVDGFIMNAVIPVMPVFSMICYGAGYGIGYLLK